MLGRKLQVVMVLKVDDGVMGMVFIIGDGVMWVVLNDGDGDVDGIEGR